LAKGWNCLAAAAAAAAGVVRLNDVVVVALLGGPRGGERRRFLTRRLVLSVAGVWRALPPKAHTGKLRTWLVPNTITSEIRRVRAIIARASPTSPTVWHLPAGQPHSHTKQDKA